MKLAIVTDSTCDLPAEYLSSHELIRVPLYVNFRGKIHKDWVEITPAEIVAGVQSGAELPTTSQPSPQDFERAYQEAVAKGAEGVLVITISSELSGTYQSASIAKETATVPITIFDTRAASVGVGSIVKKAVEMRDAGSSLEQILPALEKIRDSNFAFFTVATLDYLQKGGRIGRASALVGSLLNIKPLLGVENGRVVPIGRARGNKKAIAELVAQVTAKAATYGGKATITFLHVQDPQAAAEAKSALDSAGLEYVYGGTHEVGAVIATHVGPGTYGMYMHAS